ncbi:MAG: phenylacetate-CoA oxygenase subunit PaaJ [Bacteroidia bacterium]|nr:phenylacetate-CoA oxygenase subunit PaaJ [Bacteroidia bacterium]
MKASLTPDTIREWLKSIPDPEIPHVSVVDMGMVGEIRVEEEGVQVELIPTFAGCPAVKLLQQSIEALLREKGLKPKVHVEYSRPWQAEYVTEAGWTALRKAGFAIPKKLTDDPREMFSEVACPRCHSEAVSLTSPFGPTACRAIFYCHSCGEAFELFKPPL